LSIVVLPAIGFLPGFQTERRVVLLELVLLFLLVQLAVFDVVVVCMALVNQHH
jgi:hypothetical protein